MTDIRNSVTDDSGFSSSYDTGFGMLSPTCSGMQIHAAVEDTDGVLEQVHTLCVI